MIEEVQHNFLLFVNSKSGGCLGKKYLTIGDKTIQFKSRHGFCANVRAFDLYVPSQRMNGFQDAKNLVKAHKNPTIIICGGDGTVLWVVSQVFTSGLKVDEIHFGIIPIGTGNDFSRSLGWGGSPANFSEGNLRQLRKLVQKWVAATKSDFDLWDVSISSFSEGNISICSSNVQKQSEKRTQIKLTFCNYVGVGIDARVSYHFEKNRTKSKIINFLLYGCIGFICCLKKTEKVSQAVTQFSQSDNESEGGYSSQKDRNEQNPSIVSDHKRVNLLHKNQNISTPGEVKIKNNFRGILALNCTSYMSGVMNIFNSTKIGALNKTQGDFTQQRYDDGKLEFVGFKSQLSLAFERITNRGGKIAQGEGPFTLRFDELKKSRETYVQIDGEAYLVENLKQIRISKSKLGKIRVLVNRGVKQYS